MAKSSDNRLPLTIKYNRTAATSINKHIRYFVDYLVSTDAELKETLWYKDHMHPLLKSGFGTDAIREESKSREMLYNSIMHLDIATAPKEWYDHLPYVIPHIGSFLKVSEKENNAFTITMESYKPQASELVLKAKEKRVQDLEKLREGTSDAPSKVADDTPSEPSEMSHSEKQSTNNIDSIVSSHLQEYFKSDNFSALLQSVLRVGTQTKEHVREQVSSDENPTLSTDTNLSSSQNIREWISSQPQSYKTHPYHFKGINYIMYLQNYKESNLPQKVLSNFHSIVGLYEYLRQHAAQHNIFITPSNEVQKCDATKFSEPPTCPHTNDNTYNQDDVYAKAANALYAKMQKVIVFQDVPALETTFMATASEADGYLALYRLLQFGHPLFQTKADEVIKPTLQTRNILHFCDELKNWTLYQNMIHNKQKEEFLFNYVVQQIRHRYGDAYDRGLRPLETAVNFWRCKIDQENCSDSTFPHQATITDGKFAFTLMQQYDTNESKELFDTSIVDTPSNKVIRVTNETRMPRRYPRKKHNSQSFRFRDGIFCELCGREGHNARKDGCFDAAKFLRLLKEFSPQIFKKVEQKDPTLIKILDRKLDEAQKNMSLRIKKRLRHTVKSTTIRGAMDLVENGNNEIDDDDELWQVAKTIFDLDGDSDIDNSSEGYDSASSK